jgi:hypothetical protein
MLKRSVLTMLAGVVFACVLMLVPAAAANCMGNCEDIEGYTYVGCSIHRDAQDRIDVVVCGYIGNPVTGDPSTILHEAGHIN